MTKIFEINLKELCDFQTFFPTRKLRACLPALKSPFDKNLKLHVLYKVPCNGCNSIYLGQASQHIITITPKQQKKDSLV